MIVLTCLTIQACNPPFGPQSGPEVELDFDLSGDDEPDFEDDNPDFAGLGFKWNEEMPGGAIHFTGTLGTCTIPGPWDVWLTVTGNLGPENFLPLEGQTTVDISQVADDKFIGEFEVPMSGTLSDPSAWSPTT